MTLNSNAEKEIPEKSCEICNSNAFHELDLARTIEEICKSCQEIKYHKDRIHQL